MYTLVQLLALYTNSESHNAQHQRQTDRQTDGRQDDTDNRSYCAAVRSAKNHPINKMSSYDCHKPLYACEICRFISQTNVVSDSGALSPVHTGDYSRRKRRVAENGVSRRNRRGLVASVDRALLLSASLPWFTEVRLLIAVWTPLHQTDERYHVWERLRQYPVSINKRKKCMKWESLYRMKLLYTYVCA